MRRLLRITLCLLLMMSLAGAALAEQARMPEMPTPPPQCTAAADLVLYYNPEGGVHYHMDAHCPGVAGKYLPLSAHFLMAELGQAPYCELTPCRFCGAPAAPTAVPGTPVTPTRPPLCTPVPLCTTTPLLDETQPEPRCWVEHRQVLENFLQAWKIGDRQTMLSLCSPAWAAASDNPERELFLLIANRTPLSWEIIRQTDANGYHMYSIHVELDRHDGREPQILAYWVYLVEADGTFYVDPLFLTAPVEASLEESLPAETAAPVSAGSPENWAEHTSRFIAFMSCWQSGDLDGMLARISPQWLASVPDAPQQLATFIQTCPPGDYCIDYVEAIEAGHAVAYEFTILSGSDVAPVNGRLLLRWENGAWYVDPAQKP